MVVIVKVEVPVTSGVVGLKQDDGAGLHVGTPAGCDGDQELMVRATGSAPLPLEVNDIVYAAELPLATGLGDCGPTTTL